MLKDLRRHIMMQQVGGGLLYWWSGEDNPINGEWIDRVQQLPLRLSGAYAHTNNEYSFIGNSSWAYILLSVANFNFGHHFYIEVDVDVKQGNPMNEAASFIDFGSIQAALRNIGFQIPTSAANFFNCNWKMQGNDAPQFNIPNILPICTPNQYTTYKITFGIREYDEETDELFLVYDGNTYVSVNKVPKEEYSNFMLLDNAGSGLGGAAFLLSRGQVASRWCSSIWREVKIYNID